MYESALRRDNAVVQQAVRVLQRAPAGLVTDVDGTISPIVELPYQARVLPRARLALRRLRDCLALVAVVSGRTARDARRLVRVAGVVFVGNHGAEVSTRRGVRPSTEAQRWRPRLEQALEEIAPSLTRPGILVENKGLTASIHYRLAANRDLARVEIMAALAASPSARDLRLEEGRFVVNLLPPVEIHKGTAVRDLARQHRLRGLVYLGDDVTDTHAFQALADLRQEGVTTLSIAVGGGDARAPITREADLSLPTVDAAADLLLAVADHLEAARAPQAVSRASGERPLRAAPGAHPAPPRAC